MCMMRPDFHSILKPQHTALRSRSVPLRTMLILCYSPKYLAESRCPSQCTLTGDGHTCCVDVAERMSRAPDARLRHAGALHLSTSPRPAKAGSRSTLTPKRCKRGARKGKGSVAAASPTSPSSPHDATLETLAQASQALAREISPTMTILC